MIIIIIIVEEKRVDFAVRYMKTYREEG